MGFFSFLPGVGGGGPSAPGAPPKPQLSKMGQWAQTSLYGDVERALAGGGLLPSGYQQTREAYGKAYKKIKPELTSWTRRMIPKEDVRVRKYTEGMFERAYYGGLQELKETEELRPYEEQKEAIGLGTDLLASEKRMSAGITDIYNQQMLQNWQQQQQYGTFGTQLARGLGAAGGWMYGAKTAPKSPMAAQNYAQLMSGGFK